MKVFKTEKVKPHAVSEIRNARTELGLSQSAFADKLNVSVRTLQNWEQGHRVPTDTVIALIKRVLSGCDVEIQKHLPDSDYKNNILTDECFSLIKSIHHATENCINNALFFDATPCDQGEYLILAQRNYALMCVTHWATVFGARSETAHYSKLFANKNIECISSGSMNSQSVRSYFQSSMSMDEAEYKIFHKQSHDVRNNFISHRGDAKDSYLPELDLNMLQCFALRDKITELITLSIGNGGNRQEANTLVQYYSNNGSRHGMLLNTSRLIREFNSLKSAELSTDFYDKYSTILTSKY